MTRNDNYNAMFYEKTLEKMIIILSVVINWSHSL